MAIIVVIGKEKYLCDVGFGDFIKEPLFFKKDIRQKDNGNEFMISKYDSNRYVVRKKLNNNKWKDLYVFSTKERKLGDFEGMCRYHQTSPDSHFMKNKICSLLTENGRKTLSNTKLIVTEEGKRRKITIHERDFDKVLLKYYGIKMKI